MPQRGATQWSTPAAHRVSRRVMLRQHMRQLPAHTSTGSVALVNIPPLLPLNKQLPHPPQDESKLQPALSQACRSGQGAGLNHDSGAAVSKCGVHLPCSIKRHPILSPFSSCLLRLLPAWPPCQHACVHASQQTPATGTTRNKTAL